MDKKDHWDFIKSMLSAPVNVKQDGKWFISSCHPLDVHSQGATRQEAIRNIEEALRFFIESCLERGTLEQVFRESRTFSSNLFISYSASQFEAGPR